MEVINLTPHDVDICDEQGNIIRTYRASGFKARVSNRSEIVGYVDDVPIKANRSKITFGLPAPREGVLYIVSNTTLENNKDRKDLIAPVDKVYKNGYVVGCMSFMSNR